MKHTFKDYFVENFFPGDEEEFAIFSRALLARRPKTFRINRLKTDAGSFGQRWKARGLPMDPTMNPSVFSAGDERVKLGNEPEHLGGQIYVQDLSASMSVEILSDGRADPRENLLVLDMAASPGGKTTQLAEMYPNALVVANEIDKTRMPQLLENIERMGSDNVAVTNYSGAFFAGAGEIFDRILLDAPCSGEGIAHKAPESLEYWNLKNVKKIASIQTRLLSAALDTLAVGGVMVYSTCTLNKLENEEVLENAIAGRDHALRVTYAHRYWPHREETGGFYIAKIEKLASTAKPREGDRSHANPHIAPAGQKTLAMIEEFYERTGARPPANWRYYVNENRVLALVANERTPEVLSRWYLLRLGKRIGVMESGEFVPDFTLLRDIPSQARHYDLTEDEFARFRTGEHLALPEDAYEEGEYVVAVRDGVSVGTLRASGGLLENTISRSLKKR